MATSGWPLAVMMMHGNCRGGRQNRCQMLGGRARRCSAADLIGLMMAQVTSISKAHAQPTSQRILSTVAGLVATNHPTEHERKHKQTRGPGCRSGLLPGA